MKREGEIDGDDDDIYMMRLKGCDGRGLGMWLVRKEEDGDFYGLWRDVMVMWC